MAKKRIHIKLDSEDKYFLNNLKNRKQWLESRNEFIGQYLTKDDWYMISDYFFRLAKDYTAYANNNKMHEDKRKERLNDVKRCADTMLKLAGLVLRGGDSGD